MRHLRRPLAGLLCLAAVACQALWAQQPTAVAVADAPRLVVQSGHASTPNLSLSPAGLLAASVDWIPGSTGAATIKIWSARQGRLLCELPSRTAVGEVPAERLALGGFLAWSADSQRLAAVRSGGGLLVWDLRRCGSVSAVTSVVDAAGARLAEPQFQQLLPLPGDRALAVMRGGVHLLKPFAAVPTLQAVSGSGDSAPGPTVLAHSADGAVLLLAAADPAAGWQLLINGERLPLRGLPGAQLLPARISMAAVSARARWAAVAGPGGAAGREGAVVALIDLRQRRVVAARPLAMPGALPQPLAQALAALGPAADALADIQARRTLAGLAFSADEQRLALLRPRILKPGGNDDPGIDLRSLPGLDSDGVLGLRGDSVAQAVGDVAFGVVGNALVSAPEQSSSVFVASGWSADAALTLLAMDATPRVLRVFGGSVRGIDALRFDDDGLVVARRAAASSAASSAVSATPDARASSGAGGPGGTRQLVAWAFARGSASVGASEAYQIEDGLSALSPQAGHWLRALDPVDGRRPLALWDHAAGRTLWTQSFGAADGTAMTPLALAFSADGSRSAVLLERDIGLAEAQQGAAQAQQQSAQGVQQMQQTGREAQDAMRAASRRFAEQSQALSNATRERLAAARDPAERQRITQEHTRSLDALMDESRRARAAALRQGQDALAAARGEAQAALQQGSRERQRRRVLVLETSSGQVLGAADVASTQALPTLAFAAPDRLVLGDGESWQLLSRGAQLALQPAARLPASSSGLTVRSASEALFAVASGAGLIDVFDAASPQRPRLRLEMPGQVVTAMTWSPDERWLAVGSEQGEVALFDAGQGRLLARLFTAADGSWTVVDADGRFDTDRLEGNTSLQWVMPDEPLRAYPIELLMRDYFEPRLLTRILAGEALPPVRRLADLHRGQPSVVIERIEAERERPGQVSITVSAAATRDHLGRPGSVRDLRLFRNGQLVAEGLGEQSAEAAAPAGGEARQSLVFRAIRLPAGMEPVEFSAYAFNGDRVKSDTVRASFKPLASAAPPGAPQRRAFIVAIGVNQHDNPAWNLLFAVNDARRSAAVLADRLRATGRFAQVVSVPLLSPASSAGGVSPASQATKPIVRAVLDALAGKPRDALLASVAGADQLAAATPDDAVFVLFSGHGHAGPRGAFYLLGADTGPGVGKTVDDALLRRSISSDELSTWIKPVDAGAITMVIDACHSAAAVEAEGFKPGPMGSRGLGQLAYDKGIRILTASQADDVALESDRLQHGLLTHALINEGLDAGRADHLPRDQRIELTEWLAFGVLRVPQLYREIKTGAVRVDAAAGRGASRVPTTALAAQLSKRSDAQQPALFDFVSRRTSLTLADLARR
jgi:hypothetical protein